MLLSNLPSSRNDPAGRRQRDADPLHERLFGEHAVGFYVLVGLALSISVALTVISVM